MAQRGGCFMYYNIISAVFGVLVGLSSFGVFFFYFENRHAGIWAFVSGIYAAMTLFIHVLYKRHTLEIWYTPGNLHQIRILGVLGLLAGLTGIITYITFAILNKEDLPTLENIGSSHYIMAVWAMMTLKWGSALFAFAHVYRKRLLEEYHPLISPVS
ncbi:hypothetical protein Pmani_023800 [Petrolisthes manimaculis]|uniref:Heme transporter hrg1-B n=1 Tax=Petrolisthes manimaculis TaxID=1843537 RepID=A0AAE1PAF2_9EUCA|nr:hypothetical protein Pmani_023800 [Petrolisthes manimaculis]